MLCSCFLLFSLQSTQLFQCSIVCWGVCIIFWLNLILSLGLKATQLTSILNCNNKKTPRGFIIHPKIILNTPKLTCLRAARCFLIYLSHTNSHLCFLMHNHDYKMSRHLLVNICASSDIPVLLNVCQCLWLWMYTRPTFVQVRVGFGLVIEALATSVPSSTDRASWSDVTAGSGHPRCGAGKSDEDRKQTEREGRKK